MYNLNCTTYKSPMHNPISDCDFTLVSCEEGDMESDYWFDSVQILSLWSIAYETTYAFNSLGTNYKYYRMNG